MSELKLYGIILSAFVVFCGFLYYVLEKIFGDKK